MATLEESSRHPSPVVLTEGKVIDAFMAFEFLRRLVTPFDKTKAFQLGLVDAQGKKIKDAKTSAEKNAYTVFDRLVFRLRRIIEKLPFGKSRVASFAAALYLLREQNNELLENDDFLYESFRDYVDDLEAHPEKVYELEKLAHSMGLMEEPVNSCSPAIAGVGDGTTVVKQKPPVVRRKKDKKKLIPFALHRKSST